ncbi:MAG: hypothetical protein WB866_15495, partial [Solirubrobacterales bacterium]
PGRSRRVHAKGARADRGARRGTRPLMEAGSHTQSPDRSEFNGRNVAETSLAIVLAYFFGFLLVAIPLIRGPAGTPHNRLDRRGL